MKFKPLFIELGYRLASVDTAIVLYDYKQLLSKHIADIDSAIEPLMKDNWKSDWGIFYKVLMLEYKKSEISNQIYVVEERKKLLEILEAINSSSEISVKFKNGYLFGIFNESWEISYNRIIKLSTQEYFEFDK